VRTAGAWQRSVALAVLVIPLGGPVAVSGTERPPSPSIDHLLGGQGREAVAAKLTSLAFPDGRHHEWEVFAAWGRELFENGFVASPPTGPAPSTPISKFYTCARCHNAVREDPILSEQDPEVRFDWSERTGQPFYLTPAATLWGAVNREAFYSGYYARYQDLCIPKHSGLDVETCGVLGICLPECREMNPASLEDAIQVCSRYCSVGRYLAEWEVMALLAYSWDLELHLDDLGLTGEIGALVRKYLEAATPDAAKLAEYRAFLTRLFLRRSGNTFRGIPEISDNRWGEVAVGAYPDGAIQRGDPGRGGALYRRTCVRCHGTDVMPEAGRALVSDLRLFYSRLAKGTSRTDAAYMPEFTLQRLSRQQAADIQTYLQSLSP